MGGSYAQCDHSGQGNESRAKQDTAEWHKLSSHNSDWLQFQAYELFTSGTLHLMYFRTTVDHGELKLQKAKPWMMGDSCVCQHSRQGGFEQL